MTSWRCVQIPTLLRRLTTFRYMFKEVTHLAIEVGAEGIYGWELHSRRRFLIEQRNRVAV